MRHQIMIYQDEFWTTLELNDRVQTESQAKICAMGRLDDETIGLVTIVPRGETQWT